MMQNKFFLLKFHFLLIDLNKFYQENKFLLINNIHLNQLLIQYDNHLHDKMIYDANDYYLKDILLKFYKVH